MAAGRSVAMAGVPALRPDSGEIAAFTGAYCKTLLASFAAIWTLLTHASAAPLGGSPSTRVRIAQFPAQAGGRHPRVNVEDSGNVEI
jgi:hypothetical protein